MKTVTINTSIRVGHQSGDLQVEAATDGDLPTLTTALLAGAGDNARQWIYNQRQSWEDQTRHRAASGKQHDNTTEVTITVTAGTAIAGHQRREFAASGASSGPSAHRVTLGLVEAATSDARRWVNEGGIR